MSAYDGLVPTFHAKLVQLEARCEIKGVIIRAYFGVRDPVTQCKLWRQSRSDIIVDQKVAELRAEDCNFLADCLVKAGPQGTHPKVTNAIGGLGWHNWAEAMDYEWIVNGQVNWSTTDGGDANGYKILAATTAEVGLHSGIGWGDNDHVQLRAAGSPIDAGLSMQEIDAAMNVKFGNLIVS